MNGDNYSSRDGRRGRDYPSSRDDRDDRRDRHRDRDRRRSRSPNHRGHRRGEGDGDAYSSSRTHRDREREDRYSGRDRRGDREWDRDRGSSRRDARRDDDRHYRRDRDPYDDRRRGGRDRRDDGPGRQESRRSASPPPKKREPTPDLTDIVPVLERQRRMTQWDIKPPGYEHVTADHAKMSGMFALPGAPRQQQVDPAKLQPFVNKPSGEADGSGLEATNSRQSKRLVVSNLPADTTEGGLLSFMNIQLNGLNVIDSTDPCVLCQFASDRSFAVLEFRASQEATVALAVDGISMHADDAKNGASDGQSPGLSIRRPKDYVMPASKDSAPSDPDTVSNVVPDTINKLCITNVPTFLTDEQVMELLAAFGKPRAFVLVKDRSTEESRGIAFAQYLDPAAVNQPALDALNGMDVGGKKLKVTKACIGPTQVANFDIGITAISSLASQTNDAGQSTVLQLHNMVTPEELMDNDDYEEICDDVREECAKYGTLEDLKVPRPTGSKGSSAPGVGRIYVKFDSIDSASKAMKALAGRKFADRTVVASYFPEENFMVGAW